MKSNYTPLNLDWQAIDTVLLDMDGTLLDLHFDWHFWMEYLPKIYAEKNGLDLDEAKERIHQKIHSQQGTLNWYCLDYWSKTLNLPVAQLKQALKHMIQAHPEVITFLRRLKELNKTVVMVTNAHRDSLSLKLEQTEIGDYFDVLISAHDFGMPKEDERLWSKIQQVVPYEPKRTLLIDDNIQALKSAQSYGIKYLVAAVHVSPQMPKIDPKGFPAFENFNELLQTLPESPVLPKY
jgi:putative hydrolase of the HAD superfamily